MPRHRFASSPSLRRRALPTLQPKGKGEIISRCFIRAAIIGAALSGGAEFFGNIFGTLLGGLR